MIDPKKYSLIDSHLDKVKASERQFEDRVAAGQVTEPDVNSDVLPPVRDTGHVGGSDGRASNGGAREGAGRPRKIKFNRDDVMRQLADSKADPIQFMIDMMQDEKEDMDRRLTCAKELPHYYLPKLKSIEHSVNDELLSGGFTIVRFGKEKPIVDIGAQAQKLIEDNKETTHVDEETHPPETETETKP